MISIDLKYNSGFFWYSESGCHVKGFAHLPCGEYLVGKALLNYFNSSSDFADYKTRVSEANGMFSVIRSGEDNVWLGVDRMRSFPIFYSFKGESDLLISDSVESIINSTGEWGINEEASTEFLATGYVTGKETLVDDIFQVQASEVVEINPAKAAQLKATNTQSRIYSSYRTNDPISQTVETLLDRFNEINQGVFKRLEESLQGRTAVVALSGGFDSRWIAAMLKKVNHPEVICFSYGREGNPNMLLAEEVAGRLGLKFIPVVYTDDMVHEFLSDKGFSDYVDFMSNRCSMFFMQEYFALRYLKENALIPEDSVIIPGHSGDFFGGSQLIRHGLFPGKESTGNTVRRIFDVKYSMDRFSSTQKKIKLERIEASLEDKNIVPGPLPYSIHEDWDLKEKLAKFLVNSCKAYAWFGYEYRLPLYDYKLQDFFRDVPFEYKAGKKLYDQYLTDEVFQELDLNFKKELQPGETIQKRSRLKSRIKKVLPDSIIPTTVSRQDPIFYYEITDILRHDLAGRGIDIKIRGNSYNSLIIQWYIEYLKAEL